MAGKGQLTINNLVIVKVVFPSPGSPRRTYCPAYGGACVRYAYGEGMTHCWAAAARQCGTKKFLEGKTTVLPGPPAGGFPGVLPLAGRGKYALTCVKLQSTLSSNRRAGR